MGKDVEAIQAYLQAVGINAKIEVITVGRWIEMETFGFEDGIMIFPTGPETFRGQVERNWVTPTEPNWYSGLYWETMRRTEKLDRITKEYLRINDLAAEKAKGQEICLEIYEEAICIPLWEHQGITIAQPWVKCTNPERNKFTQGPGNRSPGVFWLDK